MDQLVSNMLKFGKINQYNTYLNIVNNFKSKESFFKTYFIAYIINQLKFVLKTKEKEKVEV